MGCVVVKQPDGLLAVWSSVVDDFVIVNADADEIATYYAADEATRVAQSWREACARAIEADTSSRMKGAPTWADLVAKRLALHGKGDPRDEVDEEDSGKDPRCAVCAIRPPIAVFEVRVPASVTPLPLSWLPFTYVAGEAILQMEACRTCAAEWRPGSIVRVMP